LSLTIKQFPELQTKFNFAICFSFSQIDTAIFIFCKGKYRYTPRKRTGKLIAYIEPLALTIRYSLESLAAQWISAFLN